MESPQPPKPPQSAYLIDLFFLLLAPMHPALVVLALLQYGVRRSPFFARGFLGGRRVTATWCIVFPGAVIYLMSNDTQNHPGSAGASTGSGEVVLPQQHQVEPEEPAVFGQVLDYFTRHTLTDEQAIDLFTVARRESGYFLSANKIRETVGGNEAAVKARVARGRPKPPEQPRTMGKATRPDEGW